MYAVNILKLVVSTPFAMYEYVAEVENWKKNNTRISLIQPVWMSGVNDTDKQCFSCIG